MYVARTSLFAAAAALFLLNAHPALAEPDATLPPVKINDNRREAGVLLNGTLVLKLRAGLGMWRPEGEAGPALQIEAFGESEEALSVPAPLIRVPEGTEIVATIQNDLQFPLRVHGLCTRDDAPCAAMDVPPSVSREVRFKSGRAGTYHYWATSTGMPLRFRGAADTQLSGALIVDPAGPEPDADRVLVITDWTSLTRMDLKELAAADDPGVTFFRLNPRYTFLVNGLSWPATERLSYRLGANVRWRVVNLSSQAHPMHLHGFYYQVDSLGDGLRDTAFGEGNKPWVVTQLLQPGATMEMTWQPERIGNWIFHCHIMDHASPARALDGSENENGHAHASNGSIGMAGLVFGVTVVDPDGTDIDYREKIGVPTRRLTLRMESEAKRYGAEPAFGFVLAEDGAAAPGAAAPGGVPVPGPTLALSRGQPVEITLANRLPEATSIHWHGMELESFYDGVHGWSGVGRRVTPLIGPGESFVARFTPPRAGTFIYHTHLHDPRQLTSGLYGPMVIMEPGETFDPATDHPIVIGRGGPGKGAPAVVNGTQYPQLVWKAGARHRIRLINITPDDIFVVSLQTADGPVSWQPLAKDGMPVAAAQGVSKPATQTIAVGETYDFEFQAPTGRQNLWINVRTPAGKWEAQAHVIIKP